MALVERRCAALGWLSRSGQAAFFDDVVDAFVNWLFARYQRVKADVARVDLLRRAQKWAAKSDSWVGRVLREVLPGAQANRLARRLRHGRPGVFLLQELARLLVLIMADLEAITELIATAKEQAEVGLHHDLLVLRLGYAAFKGLVSDVLLHDGDFSRINHLDFREWLMTHGASKADVWSAPVKGLYDLGFAYVDGEATDPTKAQAAAGVALYVTLQMLFACRGGVLWKMRAGAGDILFAPLYEVLRARGVTFKFFHRVEKLTLSKCGTMVDTVRIIRQADTVTGRAGDYNPLVDVPFGDGKSSLRCWPSEPRWEQLCGIDEPLRKELEEDSFESSLCQANLGRVVLRRRGIAEETPEGGVQGDAATQSSDEFDYVVLGLSLAGLPSICEELIEKRPAWRSMVTGISTVQTQSLQLWMTPSLEELGWTTGETVSNLLRGAARRVGRDVSPSSRRTVGGANPSGGACAFGRPSRGAPEPGKEHSLLLQRAARVSSRHRTTRSTRRGQGERGTLQGHGAGAPLARGRRQGDG